MNVIITMLICLAILVQPTIGGDFKPDKIPKGWKLIKECKDSCGYANVIELNPATQKLYCPACCSNIKGKTSYKEGKCFNTVSGFGMKKTLREICYCQPAPSSSPPLSKGSKGKGGCISNCFGSTKSGSNRVHAHMR